MVSYGGLIMGLIVLAFLILFGWGCWKLRAANIRAMEMYDQYRDPDKGDEVHFSNYSNKGPFS